MSHPPPGPSGRRPTGSTQPPAGRATGLRGLLARLRRLVGGGPGQSGPSSPTPGRTTVPLAGVQLPASWKLPDRPAAQVRYSRQRVAAGMASRTAARERRIQRQVLMAAVALVVVAVAGAVVVTRSMPGGTLPRSVRGVWETDGPRYSRRLFELSGTRLAFQTSDSTAAIHQIRRVRRTAGEEVTTYDVEYRHEGADYVFSFTYFAGPPEELRFVHQPFMIWTRVADRRKLLPEVY